MYYKLFKSFVFFPEFQKENMLQKIETITLFDLKIPKILFSGHLYILKNQVSLGSIDGYVRYKYVFYIDML